MSLQIEIKQMNSLRRYCTNLSFVPELGKVTKTGFWRKKWFFCIVMICILKDAEWYKAYVFYKRTKKNLVIKENTFTVFNRYPCKNVTEYFHNFPFQNILHLFLFLRRKQNYMYWLRSGGSHVPSPAPLVYVQVRNK